MCGIAGYIGREGAADILLRGLSELSYLGCDACGLSLWGSGTQEAKEGKGALPLLADALRGNRTGTAGIGYICWGEKRLFSPGKRVTAVSCGIIENLPALKTGNDLSALVEKYYDGDPAEALIRAAGRMEGAFSLAVRFADFPDRLFALQKNARLLLGSGEKGNMLASDLSALLPYTRKYYTLENQELGVVTPDGILLYDFDGQEITRDREPTIADLDRDRGDRGGYPHYMLKEIHEQPKTLERALMPHFMNGCAGILREEIPDTRGIRRLITVGCGSALNAGLMGKYCIEKLSGVPVTVLPASEFRCGEPLFQAGDAVMVLSQSGETADSLGALRLAKKNHIPVYAAVNTVGSAIAKEADHVIYLWAGPEIAVTATKSLTAQAAVLYTLALRLAMDRKRIPPEQAEILGRDLQRLPSLAADLLREDTVGRYQYPASLNRSKNELFVIGRGQDYAVGCEGAMKIKELSYLHCESYAAGELKHGTVSLITEGTPCLAIVTDPALMKRTVGNIKEVKARGAKVLLLCTEGMEEGRDICDACIPLPAVNALFMPLLAAVALQLYAYYTAVYRGCDVDRPRYLAKSVTAE